MARGWLTFRWDSPIRGLFWKEKWLTPVVEFFGTTWEDYAAQSDGAISMGLKVVGIVLMLSAVLPWMLTVRWRKVAAAAMVPAIVLLVIDAFAHAAETDFELGMILEHGLQWGAPLVLLTYLYRGGLKSKWRVLVGVLAGATFVGHGLYAMGFHAVPWLYQSMVEEMMGFGSAGVLLFLKIVGWLDFAAVAALAVPKFRRLGLAYMVAWALATALARPLSHDALDPWIAEFLVRIPHWLLPLAVLFGVKKARPSEPTTV